MTRRGSLLVTTSLVLFTVSFARPAAATVDGILYANIAYEDPQDIQQYCYARVPVFGEIGIPPAIMAGASLSPSYAYLSVSAAGFPGKKEIDGKSYLDLNAVSQGALIEHTYVNDAISSSGVLEYEAELDLTALATFNGSDVQGRQQTSTQAKLALLVLAKNLKDSSPSGNYRLRITFKGLPSQSGLTGEKVYASSSWAYTGASPVLAAYEKELITHFCAGGVQSALYGKADVLPSEVEPAAGGCATGGAPAGTAFGIALLLMLLVLCCRG